MTVIQNSRIPAIFSPSSALWINLIRCFAMQEHARFQTRAPSMLAGFEIKDKRHQKSNAGVSVAPQKGLISSELKKTTLSARLFLLLSICRSVHIFVICQSVCTSMSFCLPGHLSVSVCIPLCGVMWSDMVCLSVRHLSALYIFGGSVGTWRGGTEAERIHRPGIHLMRHKNRQIKQILSQTR